MHNKKEVLKMKKFMSLCMVLIFSCIMSVTASAESYGTTHNINPYYWYATTTLSGQIYSSCTISIPEIIYVGEGYTGDISVTNADIESGNEIVIRVTNLSENDTIKLTNSTTEKTIECSIKKGNKETLTKEDGILAKIPDTLFSGSDISSTTVSFQAIISDYTGAKAGKYTGTMQFEVMIEPYQ